MFSGGGFGGFLNIAFALVLLGKGLSETVSVGGGYALLVEEESVLLVVWVFLTLAFAY